MRPIRPPFTAAWAAPLIAEAVVFMPATIRISRPDKLGEWNPDTDETAVIPGTVLFEGNARVQPLRTATPINTSGNDTLIQSFIISIPATEEVLAIDFKVGDKVKVLTAQNISLFAYDYGLRETTDAATIVERTLYAGMNCGGR